jgi:release factor glutamine methyltransferase
VELDAGELAGIVTTLRASGSVFAEEEAELLAAAAATRAELAAMVGRRAGGLPLEQVVGWAEFCGLRIAVEPGVFVPRRRSEFLVHQAAALGAHAGHPLVILDMCCGAGAVGLALAHALGGAELHAADIDPVAVRCARANLAGRGQVYEGDLYEPLPASLRGRADILIADAPYVPTEELALMPAEARLHEPRVALDGGPDGVDIHRRVASGAPEWLAPGGRVLIETSERQAALTAAALAAAGLDPQVVTDEDWSATVAIGRSRPPAGLAAGQQG